VVTVDKVEIVLRGNNSTVVTVDNVEIVLRGT
jgi:hypothetical protein